MILQNISFIQYITKSPICLNKSLMTVGYCNTEDAPYVRLDAFKKIAVWFGCQCRKQFKNDTVFSFELSLFNNSAYSNR